jgi:hypothetical protein
MKNGTRSVIAFTFLYLFLAVAGAFSTGNGEFLFYILVVLFLGFATYLLHANVPLSGGVLWSLSAWGLLHMVGGLVPVPASWPIEGSKHVFYSVWIIPEFLKYDHVIHAFGFGITTWVCWQVLCVLIPHVQRTAGPLILCILAAMGLGALNEIVEFTAVLLIPDTNVGGYINTGWDLVSNMIGALLAASVIRWWPHADTSHSV